MGQEEQKSGSSNGGFSVGNISRSSSSSARKQKLKKLPQRGLGVAQLEKMRIEEQQKKNNLPSPPPPTSPSKPSIINLSLPIIPNHNLPSPPPPTSPSKPSIINLSVPIIPNHLQPCNSSSSSIPYPPDISSPNSTFNPQNTGLINSNNVPLDNSVVWQSGSAAVQGHRNVPKILNPSDYNITLEKEINFGFDPAGLAFRSSFNLPYESNPMWPLPSLTKRAQHHPKASTPPASAASFSSMVNALSGSPSSSSLNFHMEPPSNQSYYDNYTCNTPFCIEEEKIVGMKRPYPFSIENILPAAGPAFHNKCPPALYPICRSDHDSASFGYNFTSFNNSNGREASTCSTSILEPNPKKNTCNGDFLTLALPTASSATLTSPNFKLEHLSANVAFHNHKAFDFDSLPYQGNVDDPVLQPGPNIVPNRQQPYYCFLPPAIMQIGQPTSALVNCDGGEVGENIDLNLKL